MKKRMVITGHRGLLGSACVRHFSASREIVLFEGDCRDQKAVAEFFEECKPSEVIHCAAKVGGVLANKTHPVSFLLNNLIIQNNVIASCAHNGVETFVFVGTSCMFPRDANLPVVEESLLTGRLDDSVEAYAIAKIAGWRLCKAYWEEFGKRFLTVNPSNIYGVNDNYGSAAHVIPALIRKFSEARVSQKPPIVWGDGSAVREFIFSDDVASAIETVIEKWNSPEVISIGTGLSHSILELTEILAQISGITQRVSWDSLKPVGIPRKTFDVSKLLSLGWSPSVSLKEGIQIAWDDFHSSRPRGL